jgi:hypothetical protein
MKGLHTWETLVVVALLVVVVWMLIPALFSRPDGGYRRSCLNNVKRLGLALKQYSYDFGERYPWRAASDNPAQAWLDLGMVYPNYTASWRGFLCPKSKDRPFEPVCALGDLKDHPLHPLLSRNNHEVISYAYGVDASDRQNPTAWTENARATVRLLADKKAGVGLIRRSNHRLDGRYVLYHDGHAQWEPGTRAVDPDEDDAAIGAPRAKEYRAWWSDPPYYGK